MKIDLARGSILVLAVIAAIGLGRAGWVHSFSSGPNATSKPLIYSRAIPSYLTGPLSFEPNQGQSDSQVKFIARGPGYVLYLTSNEAILAPRRHTTSFSRRERSSSSARTEVVRMKLVGTDARTSPVAFDQLPVTSNYFIGNDSRKWCTNVPRYGKVEYHSVYAKTDLVYHANQNQLEYDFMVAPGGDPSQIKLAFEGLESIRIEDSGELTLRSRGTQLKLNPPYAYQVTNGAEHEVTAHFVSHGKDQIGFKLENYDRSNTLIIDPVLVYSTYFGGAEDEGIFGIDFDPQGNIYIAGETSSTNFPLANPAQSKLGGNYDAFVSKFDSTGSRLIYSTYLGGRAFDHAVGIAVDEHGSAYLAGVTQSSDFPVHKAAQPIFGGDTDAFVARLTASGALLFSTYVGGTSRDEANGMALDKDGAVYIAGYTNSTNFPTSPSAFQKVCDGGAFPRFCAGDAFVTKLSPSGRFVYSTYLGGSAPDFAAAIAVDRTGAAYVTGQTGSTNFPIRNPYQSSLAGLSNAFVSKLDSQGKHLVFSTYLGGDGFDAGQGVAVDVLNNVYLAGTTTSSNFPTVNPLQPTNRGGQSDGFVTKLLSDGSRLSYSTYLGGSGWDFPFRIAVDAQGNASVIGFTSSTDFPTINALQSSFNGGFTDAFVVKFIPAGLPRFSTYLGGTGDDWGYAINADLAGNLWVGGSTSSLNFALVKPYQPFYAGGPFDAYVSKIAIPPVEAVAVLQAAVSNLVYEGLLSQQASHPLRAKLEHARNQLSEGDMEGATEQLQGFIRKAQHDIARGTLSPADGQRLSSAAADVLERLGSGED